MLHIVMVRPGSTDFDHQGRIQGTLDIPLSQQGLAEVDRAAGELADQGLEAIYTSDCQPALQTAERLAEALGVKVKKLSNMQNLDHGLWQGMLVDEVKHKQPKVYRQWLEQPECLRPPDGEMVCEARQRVAGAMSKVLKKHKQGKVAVVVPEPLASLARCYLGHCQLGNLWRPGVDNQIWESIEIKPQQLAAARA